MAERPNLHPNDDDQRVLRRLFLLLVTGALVTVAEPMVYSKGIARGEPGATVTFSAMGLLLTPLSTTEVTVTGTDPALVRV